MFAIHFSGVSAEFLVIGRIAHLLFESGALCLLPPGLTRRMCQTVLFHHDLVPKEQCTSVCTKITPVLLLTLHLVRIHSACLIVNFLLVLCGEKVPPSSWRNHSMFVWLTQDAIFVVAVRGVRPRLPPSLKHRRATYAKSSLPSSRASGKTVCFPYLLGNFDACDFVRQASELENSLLARD